MTTAYRVRTSELAEARQLSKHLPLALDGRVVIEQATGSPANQHDVSVDEAFEMLRSHRHTNRIRLSQLSEAVASFGLQLPRPEQPGPV